jgi:hypothetical protein
MKKNKILNLLLVLSLPLMAFCCSRQDLCNPTTLYLYFETSIQQTDSVAVIAYDKRNPSVTITKYYTPRDAQNIVYEKDNKY